MIRQNDDSFVDVKRSVERDSLMFPPINNASPKPNFHYSEHNAVLPKAGPNYQRSSEIAEETRRNMGAPGVEQFRHITTNKGYGITKD